MSGSEGEIELQDIHPRLAEHAPLPAFSEFRDQGAEGRGTELPGPRHPCHLIVRGGGADVRVQTTAGGGDQVDRDRQAVARIGRASCRERV